MAGTVTTEQPAVSGPGAVSTRTPDPRDFDLCRTPEPPVDEGTDPGLIGTLADPDFVAHQDHKHPVEGCGYCPPEDET